MDKPTRQSKFQELTPSQLTQITGGGWLEDTINNFLIPRKTIRMVTFSLFKTPLSKDTETLSE